ncbi:hypothetical protein KI387_000364, partial [Taxus chinensis]
MELASDEGLRTKLYKIGKRLKKPSFEKSVLLHNIEEILSYLCLIEQSDYSSMFSVVAPLLTHLARSSLLRHEEADVRLLVITCISEITWITTSSFPCDDTTMEEVYELLIKSFQNLWDITNPHFDKRIKILKNMAK